MIPDSSLHSVGCKVGTKVGRKDGGKISQLLHISVQWFFTSLILQAICLSKFSLTHLQLLFSFENFVIGTLPGWSLQLGVGGKIGAAFDSKVGTKVGCEVDGKTLQLIHSCLQWFCTSLILQTIWIWPFKFSLSHLQLLFSFENFVIGMLPDSSSQSSFGSKVCTTDGCEVEFSIFWSVGSDDGKSVQLLHISLQWFLTSSKSQTLFWSEFFLTHLQLLFLFENSKFGILPDLSLHPDVVGNNEGWEEGCDDGSDDAEVIDVIKKITHILMLSLFSCLC